MNRTVLHDRAAAIAEQALRRAARDERADYQLNGHSKESAEETAAVLDGLADEMRAAHSEPAEIDHGDALAVGINLSGIRARAKQYAATDPDLLVDFVVRVAAELAQQRRLLRPELAGAR
jgi:hypothetical protein